MSDAGIHAVQAFVDLSNIWYGLLEVAPSRDEQGLPLRLSAENLGRVLRAGRDQFRQLAVTNAEVPLPVIDHFGKVGEVILRESGRRTGTGRRTTRRFKSGGTRRSSTTHQASWSWPPATARDGGSVAGSSRPWTRHGGGRGVEVLSWGVAANRALRDWAARVDASFVDLDDYYFSVSFVEGGRRVQPVSLRHRPTSEPTVRGRVVR